MDRSTLALFTFLADLLLRAGLAVMIVLRSRGTPSVRLAWLLVVIIVPFGGGFAYLLLGGVRIGTRRMRRHRAAHEWLRSRNAEETHAGRIPGAAAARLIEQLGGEPLTGGNVLDVYSNSDEAATVLIADIDRAQHSCDVLFYIFLDDLIGVAVGQALMAAARRGASVRVLVDAFGSKRFLRSRLRREMEGAGVQVRPAMPVHFLGLAVARLDHRNHRKIAVIDGRIGWTGSMNIADKTFELKRKYAPWVDVMVRVDGPAVYDLHTLFIEDWVVESRDSPDRLRQVRPEPHANGAVVQVLGTAPHRYPLALRELSLFGFPGSEGQITMTTPYFVPDEVTVTALTTSARSGIETRLIVPRKNDSPLVAAASRSFYERLLEAGVRIFEFRPGLLHAKTVVIGRDRSVVSTANLDRRSYELNFEVTLIVLNESFNARLRAIHADYIAQSDEVRLDAWRTRGAVRRFTENLVGTMAPLL